MARKSKIGLDYFSHDVNSAMKKKLRIIMAKHGVVAYGVFFLLLEELYKEKGYYLRVDEDFQLLFCCDYNLDHELFKCLLDVYIMYNLFNQDVYMKSNKLILTSDRCQENFIEAAKRRQKIVILEELLVIEKNTIPLNITISEKPTYINVDNMLTSCEHHEDISTQSKVKETKVKESKEDNIVQSEIEPESDSPPEKINPFLFTEKDCDEIYKDYPRKEGKANGYKTLLKLKKKDFPTLTPLDLIKSIKTYSIVASDKEKKYIKMFSSWINGRCWEDEYEIDENTSDNKDDKNVDSRFKYSQQVPENLIELKESL